MERNLSRVGKPLIHVFYPPKERADFYVMVNRDDCHGHLSDDDEVIDTSLCYLVKYGPDDCSFDNCPLEKRIKDAP